MKKSVIEKNMLAKRLRKKINENEIVLSNNHETYSVNESELKNLIDEAITETLKKRGLL